MKKKVYRQKTLSHRSRLASLTVQIFSSSPPARNRDGDLYSTRWSSTELYVRQDVPVVD
jgi:hypothetical protein